MKVNRKNIEDAVLFFAKMYGREKGYEALISSKTTLPELVKMIVYDLFLHKFNHYPKSQDAIGNYHILFEYATELSAKGWVDLEGVDKDPRDVFISLLGLPMVNNIENGNWVSFTRYKNSVELNFIEKDNHQDNVIFFSLCYDEDTKKWYSENCIEEGEFDTYQEVRAHAKRLESRMLSNGFNTPNLPDLL